MISVVVPCRNEGKYIEQFLNSLLQQDCPGAPWEVLIADGESSDGTRELLNRYCATHARIRIISNPGRIVSTGLNAAIRAAKGDIIIRMDAHTEYAPNYLRESVAALEQTGADNVGGVPRVRADTFRMRVLAAAFHSSFAVGGSTSHAVDHEGWVESVSFGCWRKETMLRIGLFDETLLRNQDDEFNLRLRRAGGKVWQSKRIVSWYHPRSTAAGLFTQYFQYGYWKVAVMRKYGNADRWRHVVPGAFVLTNILLVFASLLGMATGSRALFVTSGSAWLAIVSLYAIASLAAATATAWNVGWQVLPVLPFVFWIYHYAYGLGFVAGMVRFRHPEPVWPARRSQGAL